MMPVRLVCVGVVLALAFAGWWEGSPRAVSTVNAATVASVRAPSLSRGSGSSTVAAAYRLSRTVACLKQRGIAVAPIARIDRRLRAIRDLAQRTSRQARSGRQVVAMAFGRTANDAVLLVDVLRVPNDPYRLERLRNVVLLYLPKAARLRTAVRTCLA